VLAGECPDVVRDALFVLSHLLERDIDGAWLPSIVNLSAYIAGVTFFEPGGELARPPAGQPGGVPAGRGGGS